MRSYPLIQNKRFVKVSKLDEAVFQMQPSLIKILIADAEGVLDQRKGELGN